MPAYRLVDPKTKKVYKYTGDRPPTQDEAKTWIWEQENTLKGKAGTMLSDIGQIGENIGDTVGKGLSDFATAHPTIAGISRRMMNVQADVPPEKRRQTSEDLQGGSVLPQLGHGDQESWPSYLAKSGYNALAGQASPAGVLGAATTRPMTALADVGETGLVRRPQPLGFGGRQAARGDALPGAARPMGRSSLDPSFLDAEFTDVTPPTPPEKPLKFGARPEPPQLGTTMGNQGPFYGGNSMGRRGLSTDPEAVRPTLPIEDRFARRQQYPTYGPNLTDMSVGGEAGGQIGNEGLSPTIPDIPEPVVAPPPRPTKAVAPPSTLAPLAPPVSPKAARTVPAKSSRAYAGLTNKELEAFVNSGDKGAIAEATKRGVISQEPPAPPQMARDKPPQTMGARPNKFANTPDDVLQLSIKAGDNAAIEEGYARGLLSDKPGVKGKGKKMSAAEYIKKSLSTGGKEGQKGMIKFPGLGPKVPEPPHAQGFADWVNNVKSTAPEGDLAARNFKDMQGLGKQALTDFMAGSRQGRLADLESYIKGKTQAVKQVFGQNPEQLKRIFSKMGDYNNVPDFVRYYEKSVNKLIADRQFKLKAFQEGWIAPRAMAPADWKVLKDPVAFPPINVKGYGQQPMMASKDLARKINNYLAEPEEHLQWMADKASISKNLSMSGGVPGTGMNAHGANILARTAIADPESIPKVSRYIVNPAKATRDYDAVLHKAPWAVKRGLSLTSEGHEMGVSGSTNLVQKTGKKVLGVLGKYFEDPLFQKIIPATKIDHFYRMVDKLEKSGMPREAAGNLAAKIGNNVYGGINWEAMGRSKNLQNFARIVVLAPDWLESNVRLGKGMAASLLNPKTPQGKIYQKAVASSIGAYIAADVVNYNNSGKHMWENGPGHALDVYAGKSGDTDRWVRPFGTAADFARLPVDLGQAIFQSQDLGQGFKILKNRLSTTARPIGDLIFNQDDFGRPITGKDMYGRPIPMKKQATGIAGELTQTVTPPYVKSGMDYLSGRSTLEQATVGAVEGPVRYSHQPKGKFSRRGRNH